ncbi:PREDICTED: tyrosine-protein kinase CSK-like [Amphimedon queenslandica]|uniref:Tyrosine-protein kinase n=1 Tax=Amphimedon queenslandica TaxID=400682 RepID=A0A1X7UWE9_AMPQE|nr:PREDICTED: tyrosine-protein kinase CSK-like [Amphimedon queenslandica]XP_019852015.1 PREDICTED: tyrosine-protein kinase CSK-like [Amphimedon queenslandica]|eukprot:XP_003386644.1 PREDICTED: tyrosine-protein kinase CSK-like [Amphimedon queenslandica]
MAAIDTPWVAGTKCTAKYNFIGSSPHDLPFRKGDILTIVSPTKDPNWYKAKRGDGLEGMIPYNYVTKYSDPSAPPPLPPTRPPMSSSDPGHHHQQHQQQPHHEGKGAVKLHTMPWFHGKLSRQDGEKLLTPPKNGLFLVRESVAYVGDYTLSVCYDGKVEHYRVRRNEKNWVTVDDEEYFENLVSLVEHYQKDADGLCSRLKCSVEKKGNIDIVVSLEDFKKQGWAITREELHSKSIIGKGEFGEVWLGEYRGSKVAIKMLKEIKSQQQTQQFLAEASVMTTLSHPNLVQLIGVSVDSTQICLVTEYMGKGSLEQYLRSRGRAVITKQNQIDFAKHVCSGMVYLESHNFIHRDLASRNVLLSDQAVAKVADFGLAREGVTRSDSQKLPVKWTAPEALKDNKFSNKSDVWSFGILLWEIYSYGRVPYPRIPVNDIVQHVERGYRMDAPDGCPPHIYTIMMSCWDANPELRPTFAKIEKEL